VGGGGVGFRLLYASNYSSTVPYGAASRWSDTLIAEPCFLLLQVDSVLSRMDGWMVRVLRFCQETFCG